ncbi:20149_t:CDS:2 [Funneliformis geosporum]|uniref:4228_t:CDS:1 n=1 Tax=Funneliformis geosporum TaxID=1117311 RepID=A0A9W4SN70_9GLOM|nr:20149_t:CDS:2 [Funneliformis geosporum]CAI2174745.1 4228_t:CDS:2 [Funneliformis geosporum]
MSQLNNKTVMMDQMQADYMREMIESCYQEKMYRFEANSSNTKNGSIFGHIGHVPIAGESIIDKISLSSDNSIEVEEDTDK